MAESGASKVDKVVQNEFAVKDDQKANIKQEVDVNVKPEPHECVACTVHSIDTYDIYTTNTATCGSSLHDFLCKFTHVDRVDERNSSKYMCKNCYDLVNVLEQAELEYNKLKQTFEAIISKNPLFANPTQPSADLRLLKTELLEELHSVRCEDIGADSEDEPLAITRKKRYRKPVKRVKKSTTLDKRKSRRKNTKESWECNLCGSYGATGGTAAESAHKLAMHDLEEFNIRDVKKEDSTDGSQNQCNNGIETSGDSVFKIEIETEWNDDDDDDDSPDFLPDDLNSSTRDTKRSKVLGRSGDAKTVRIKCEKSSIKKRKKVQPKVMHQCDKCNAKYSSLSRLSKHKLKHEEVGKPPYICEVCGAHYKHKRACDIHIALHKGISDWKCEECNKLFPSKGALQRHNNIHTGKPNYQCDLCGKSFIHTSSFKMHKLSHSGVKPHACDVCGLALLTRSHLKRHKRVHSGEKRHECTICGKRFSERYNLMAHSKSHEGGAGAEPKPPTTRRHLFRCNFCQERYERRYMLERHMSTVHGRTLERPPPTPRNTMSKLLKAQAQARREHSPSRTEGETKLERSPDSRPTPVSKLAAQLTSSAASGPSAWSNAYVAEFALRHDYSH